MPEYMAPSSTSQIFTPTSEPSDDVLRCRRRDVASNHLATLGCHVLSPCMGGDVRERRGPQLSALRGRTHDRCMRTRGADGSRCMLCCGSAITSPRSIYQYMFMDNYSASSPYSCTYMYIHFFSKSRLYFIKPYFTTSV